MITELERRAIAAEKTVDVLKRKVVALYNGDTSAMHRQVEAAKAREAENKKKRELAEVRAGELARYSETLEMEVARRTAAIKTILDHVTFGFLVVGRDLVVKEETTRSCVGLFDTPCVEGRKLTELLRLDGRREQELLVSCDQVFEDLLPEEVSIAQMRQKFELGGAKMLRAEGSVIRDATGAVSGILFTISDITALEEATRESHDNRTLVGILRQKESFRSFLTEVRQQLAAARADISDQAVVRRVVHTIKGNSASYGLTDVVDLAQVIEERRQIEVGALEELTEEIRRFLRKNRGVLEIDFEELGEQSFELSGDQIAQFRGILAKMGGGTDELREWTARVLTKPTHQLLGPIAEFGARLAERLGKGLDFDLEGGDTVVDVETMRPVFASIAHLVRNAIDHGLEPPHERGGKRRLGRVSMRISEPDGVYRVEVEDDGRGIDLARLRERAIERGFATRESIAEMSDGGLSLIFVDGLSTAPEVTSVSGRGIGMSAVRSAVERARGTLEIHTRPGVGTTLALVIPKPALARRAS